MKRSAYFLCAVLLMSPALAVAMDLGSSPETAVMPGQTPTAVPSIPTAPKIVPTKPYSVAVAGGGVAQASAGKAIPISFLVTNNGKKDDTYVITTTTDVTWGDFANTLPPVSLKSGESAQFKVSLNVPDSIVAGTQGHFALKAVSRNNASITDTGELLVTVAPAHK